MNTDLLQFLYEAMTLDEAKFQGRNHTMKHWEKHCLKEGEEFNPNDPKFPPMSFNEYCKRAEQLSLAKAGDSKQRSGIFGFVINNEKWRGPRCIKIKWDSDLVPGYMEEVAYKDDPSDDQVFTYMLRKKSRINKELNAYYDELPENK